MSAPALNHSDLWCTPREILDLVEEVGRITLDPCPGPKGWTGAASELRLDEGNDGLDTDWYGHWYEDLGGMGLAFVNPPFGRGHLDLWAPKIAAEARRGLEVIAVLPATPGPAWWQDHVTTAQAICFLRGRPKFLLPETLKPKSTGTKDCAIAYWGDRARRFARVFAPHGWVVALPEVAAGAAGEGE